MAKAILPGSYDPITVGHLDIILRAKKIYGDVTVGILFNSEKEYTFTPEQKKSMIEHVLKESGIPVIIWDGMLFELCNKMGYTHIVKGIREGDGEYETEMARYNSSRCSAETVFLKANVELENVSSTLVRRYLKEGKDISRICPAEKLAEEYYAENTKM